VSLEKTPLKSLQIFSKTPLMYIFVSPRRRSPFERCLPPPLSTFLPPLLLLPLWQFTGGSECDCPILLSDGAGKEHWSIVLAFSLLSLSNSEGNAIGRWRFFTCH
jgi:hypothetical protein